MAVTEKDILMQKLDKQTGETIIMYPITKKENILGLEVEKDVFTKTNKYNTQVITTCRRQGNVVTLNFEITIGAEQFGNMLTGDFGFSGNIPEKYRPLERKQISRREEENSKYYSVFATITTAGTIIGGIQNTTGESKFLVLTETFIVD